MNFLVWPLRHRHVVVVLAVIALGLGLQSVLTMPRQDTPTISIHKALVIALYPGATTAQVEQQLTRPIEAYLFTFTEVDPVKSHSVTRDGQVVVTVELHEWVADKEGFWSRLRLGLAELDRRSCRRTPSAHPGNHDVQHDDVGLPCKVDFKGLVTVFLKTLFKDTVTETGGVNNLDWLTILDNQRLYFLFHSSFSTFMLGGVIGIRKKNPAPLPSPSLSAQIFPPCSSTMLLVSESPNPVP